MGKNEYHGKILLVGNFPPPFGGISSHVAALREKLIASNLSVAVLNATIPCRDSSSNVISSAGRLHFITNIFMHTRLFRMVHLHTNGHNRRSWQLIRICGAACRLWKRPYLVTLHSGNCPEYIQGMKGMERILSMRALNKASGIIAVNERIRTSLTGFIDAQDRITVIPAYLGLVCKSEPSGSAPVQHFLRSRGPILTSMLAFRPEYRVGDLLETVLRLKGEFPDLGLMILGSGQGREIVEADVRRMNLGNNILIQVDMEPKYIYDILQKSHVFIRSTAFDGDALSVREAMTLGIPVIATETDFRPEGVIKYGIGDVNGLCQRIRTALKKPHSAARTVGCEGDFFGEIMSVYKRQ